MNKRRIFTLIIFATIILVYFIVVFKTKKYIAACSFSGKVESIRHDAKKQPIVIINGKTYHWSFGRDEILLNDSLVKKSGSILVRQYRGGRLINEFYWE